LLKHQAKSQYLMLAFLALTQKNDGFSQEKAF
jgi:hypothetical protein